MGNSASKATRSVARAAPARRYPQRVPPQVSANDKPAERTTGPSVNPPVHASETYDDDISRDAADPDFARSLRSIGPVTPPPRFSNSSAFRPDTAIDSNLPNLYPDPAKNPALRILESRSRLSSEAEAEFAQIGKKGAAGRQFLDILVIRQILQMRDRQGLAPAAIEQKLELKSGVVSRLGKAGVVAEPK